MRIVVMVVVVKMVRVVVMNPLILVTQDPDNILACFGSPLVFPPPLGSCFWVLQSTRIVRKT